MKKKKMLICKQIASRFQQRDEEGNWDREIKTERTSSYKTLEAPPGDPISATPYTQSYIQTSHPQASFTTPTPNSSGSLLHSGDYLENETPGRRLGSFDNPLSVQHSRWS